MKKRFDDKTIMGAILSSLYKMAVSIIFLAFLLFFIMLVWPEDAHAGELNLKISAEHTSNPELREAGYGLNAAFLDLEYQNDGFFIAGGLGVHSESADCPEVCYGGNTLARVRIGYTINIFK